MTEPEPSTSPRATDGLRLRDLIALTIGYGLAALLLRSFWPRDETPTVAFGAIFGFVYLWLGMAMSGPVLLLTDRRDPPTNDGVARTDPPSRYSREECAWVAIGSYFIVLTLFVLPARHREMPWGAILLVQLTSVLGILVALRRRSGESHVSGASRWTRRAARILLVLWLPAWVLMVAVIKR